MNTRLTFEDVFDRLEMLDCKPHPSGTSRAYANCPSHDDRSPSLSIAQGDTADVIITCFAGCSFEDVIAALTGNNVKPRDPERVARARTRKPYRLVPQENYRYESHTPGVTLTKYRGQLVEVESGEVKRDKAFTWTHTVDGVERRGAGGHIPRLYRHDLIAWAQEHNCPLYLSEGEKDSDAVVAQRCPAVSVAHGAGKWLPEWTAELTGLTVPLIICADNDEAGRKHAAAVAGALVDLDVRVVLPVAGKDVSDHLDAGHTLAELRPMNASKGKATPKGRRVVATVAASIVPKPVPWGWDQRLQAGALSIAAGREATGKSSFSVWMAAQITKGTLPGVFLGTSRAVGIAAGEDSWEHIILPRLIAVGADRSLVYRIDAAEGDVDGMTLVLPTDTAGLKKMISAHDMALLIIDPLMSNIDGSLNTNNSREARKALDPLNTMAQQTGVMALGICHFNKSTGSDISSLISGSGAFKDAARSVLGFVHDEASGERIMQQTKNSAGRDDLPSLSYLLDPLEVSTPSGITTTTRFIIGGTATRTAKDVLREARHDGDRDAIDGKRSQTDACTTWLRAWMTTHNHEGVGSVIKAEARAEEHDWSRKVWRRAMDIIGIDATGKTSETHSRNLWRMAINPASHCGPHSGPNPVNDRGHSDWGQSAEVNDSGASKPLDGHTGPSSGEDPREGATVAPEASFVGPSTAMSGAEVVNLGVRECTECHTAENVIYFAEVGGWRCRSHNPITYRPTGATT